MKKRYQTRLEKIDKDSIDKNRFANDSLVENTFTNESDDVLPEIPELDSILELPQPLKEMALVQAICHAHRSSVKQKSSSKQTSLNKHGNAPLAAWVNSNSKSQQQDNQN